MQRQSQTINEFKQRRKLFVTLFAFQLFCKPETLGMLPQTSLYNKDMNSGTTYFFSTACCFFVVVLTISFFLSVEESWEKLRKVGKSLLTSERLPKNGDAWEVKKTLTTVWGMKKVSSQHNWETETEKKPLSLQRNTARMTNEWTKCVFVWIEYGFAFMIRSGIHKKRRKKIIRLQWVIHSTW